MQRAIFESSVTADGTSVVAEYTLKMDLPAGAGEQFEKTFEMQKATFEAGLKQMQSEEPAVSSFIVKFFDKSGNLIAEFEVE